MFNGERGPFPSQLEANPRGESSSSFGCNDVIKLNVVISLQTNKKDDAHVGE